MKIYNKIILAWNKETQRYDDVVYEDSFEYGGDIDESMPCVIDADDIVADDCEDNHQDYGEIMGDSYPDGCSVYAPWYCAETGASHDNVCYNIYDSCSQVPQGACQDPCTWEETQISPLSGTWTSLHFQFCNEGYEATDHIEFYDGGSWENTDNGDTGTWETTDETITLQAGVENFNLCEGGQIYANLILHDWGAGQKAYCEISGDLGFSCKVGDATNMHVYNLQFLPPGEEGEAPEIDIDFEFTTNDLAPIVLDATSTTDINNDAFTCEWAILEPEETTATITVHDPSEEGIPGTDDPGSLQTNCYAIFTPEEISLGYQAEYIVVLTATDIHGAENFGQSTANILITVTGTMVDELTVLEIDETDLSTFPKSVLTYLGYGSGDPYYPRIYSPFQGSNIPEDYTYTALSGADALHFASFSRFIPHPEIPNAAAEEINLMACFSNDEFNDIVAFEAENIDSRVQLGLMYWMHDNGMNWKDFLRANYHESKIANEALADQPKKYFDRTYENIVNNQTVAELFTPDVLARSNLSSELNNRTFLVEYYDEDIQSENYELNQAPVTARLIFYGRIGVSNSYYSSESLHVDGSAGTCNVTVPVKAECWVSWGGGGGGFYNVWDDLVDTRTLSIVPPLYEGVTEDQCNINGEVTDEDGNVVSMQEIIGSADGGINDWWSNDDPGTGFCATWGMSTSSECETEYTDFVFYCPYTDEGHNVTFEFIATEDIAFEDFIDSNACKTFPHFSDRPQLKMAHQKRLKIAFLDWGDGETEYFDEPYDAMSGAITHVYEDLGVYEITGVMFWSTKTGREDGEIDYYDDPDGELYGHWNNDGDTASLDSPPGDAYVWSYKKFNLNISVNKNIGFNDEFEALGGDDYTFVPYDKTVPIVSGLSHESLYYKSLSLFAGYNSFDEQWTTIPAAAEQGYRMRVETALANIDESLIPIEGEGGTLTNYIGTFYSGSVDNTGQIDNNQASMIINNGALKNPEEFGDWLGFTDIGQTRVFKKPLQMWEMLGFEGADISDDVMVKLYFVMTPTNYMENSIDYYIDDELYYQIEGISEMGDYEAELIFPLRPDEDTKLLKIVPTAVEIQGGIFQQFWYGDTMKLLDKDRNIIIDSIDYTNEICNTALSEQVADSNGYGDYWDIYEHMFTICETDIGNIAGWRVDSNSAYSVHLTLTTNGDSSFIDISRTILEQSIIDPDIVVLGTDAGNPGHERYWKNIIPESHILSDREGILFDETGQPSEIDESSSQEWIGANEYGHTYYYPALPKLSAGGAFSELLGLQTDGGGVEKIPFGAKETWNSDDTVAPITQAEIDDESLNCIVDLNFSEVTQEALEDNSGGQNVGMLIGDYSFDSKTKSIKMQSYNRIVGRKGNARKPTIGKNNKIKAY